MHDFAHDALDFIFIIFMIYMFWGENIRRVWNKLMGNNL